MNDSTAKSAATGQLGFSTRAIHAGQEPDPATGAIMTPIYATSTYVQTSPGVHKGYDYARTANPTRAALEACVASLVPLAQWLVENVPSPPVERLLNEFLPTLPAKQLINGKVLPPPATHMSTLKKAITRAFTPVALPSPLVVPLVTVLRLRLALLLIAHAIVSLVPVTVSVSLVLVR